ncbi:hypothetical protein GOBAR_AA04399 [Gossypium barbadense]|uniref:Uncharacterized protein n=1 Tax=Gossypium barbadense TaxID=3634 RepID=A0A2P5YKP3_GOSBA|nr:hypothetical protein GOBAR_AA04399 [Gossypium barbadense]
MMETRCIPRWGKSSRRNVICKAAEVGPGKKFRWNRRRKFDVEESGMFHVVTTKNNEVHFVCDGGIQMAELWVRGILLVTYGNDTEIVILNELARALVVDGSQVKKHTRGDKGSPHSNLLRMMETRCIPRWGKSSRRNVICKAAEVGPGKKFRWNRRRKFDVEESGMFHVVTTKNNEVHFVCDGGIQMAELWVRGILLVTSEAIFGKPKQV